MPPSRPAWPSTPSTSTGPTIDTIGRANLDGTDVDQGFITDSGAQFGVAVDGEHVYWTRSLAGTIGRANLDGTDTDQTFDHRGQRSGRSRDRRPAHLLGQQRHQHDRPRQPRRHRADQSFITGANAPLGVAVDGQHVYWANTGTDTIGRANLDGTAA